MRLKAGPLWRGQPKAGAWRLLPPGCPQRLDQPAPPEPSRCSCVDPRPAKVACFTDFACNASTVCDKCMEMYQPSAPRRWRAGSRCRLMKALQASSSRSPSKSASSLQLARAPEIALQQTPPAASALGSRWPSLRSAHRHTCSAVCKVGRPPVGVAVQAPGRHLLHILVHPELRRERRQVDATRKCLQLLRYALLNSWRGPICACPLSIGSLGIQASCCCCGMLLVAAWPALL